MPAPKRAPITVCVPEIGMPKQEDEIIKRKEELHTANIIVSYQVVEVSSKLGMIETESVPVTAPAQNIAPKNSASAPPRIRNFRESALEP